MSAQIARVRPSPTSRSVPEWVGRTPDSDPPPHVIRRIFDTHFGRCHLTGVGIDPIRDEWHVEHIKSLRNGGENRESNLAPALIEPHRAKTAVENSGGAKADRVREKLVLGIRKSKRPLPCGKNSPWMMPLGARRAVRRAELSR